MAFCLSFSECITWFYIYIYRLILNKIATRNVEHVEKLIRNRASNFTLLLDERSFVITGDGGKKIVSQHSDTVYFRHLHLSKFSSMGGGANWAQTASSDPLSRV